MSFKHFINNGYDGQIGFYDYLGQAEQHFLKTISFDLDEVPKYMLPKSVKKVVKKSEIMEISQGKKLYVITLTNKGEGANIDDDFLKIIDKVLSSKMFAIERYLVAIEHHKSGELHCHMIISTQKYLDKSKIIKINTGNHVKVENIKNEVHLRKCVNYLLKSESKDGIDERVENYGYRSLFANFELIIKYKKNYKIYNILTDSYYEVKDGKKVHEEEIV